MKTIIKTTNYFKQVIVIISLSLILQEVKAAGDLSVSFSLSNYVGYNISCHGASDGSIIAVVTGGSPPYHYLWSNGSTSHWIEELTAGNYIFKMYNAANTLIIQDTITLVQPDSMYVVFNASNYGDYNISHKNGSDGTLSLQFHGGTPPYEWWWEAPHSWIDTYYWDMDGVELNAGDYTLHYFDANSCESSQTTTLIEPDSLRITNITDTNVTCYGGTNGSIYISITGGIEPYTFNWTANDGHYIPGNTNQNISHLIAGTYSVQVHSAYGETKTASITLSQGAAMQVSSTKSLYPNNYNISCYHCYNGSITASVISNGQSPYNFIWSSGQSTSTISTLGPGIYTVNITDAHGCTASRSDTLREEGNQWNKTGDSLSSDTTKFLGTIDSTVLILKTSNTKQMVIEKNGDIILSRLTGTGDRQLKIGSDGKLIPGEQIESIGGQTGTCVDYPAAPDAWRKFNSSYNLINCVSNFGFGVAPIERVTIGGKCRFEGPSTSYTKLGHNGFPFTINTYGGDIKINDDSHSNIQLCPNGGVVTIGTVTPIGNYKLFVREGIRAEKVRVDVAQTSGWSDYVFKKDYKLKSLDEIEAFIKHYGHLPNIPTSEEVEKEGIDVAEMQAKLLEKVEELTLYILQLKKENKDLRSMIIERKK